MVIGRSCHLLLIIVLFISTQKSFAFGGRRKHVAHIFGKRAGVQSPRTELLSDLADFDPIDGGDVYPASDLWNSRFEAKPSMLDLSRNDVMSDVKWDYDTLRNALRNAEELKEQKDYNALLNAIRKHNRAYMRTGTYLNGDDRSRKQNRTTISSPSGRNVEQSALEYLLAQYPVAMETESRPDADQKQQLLWLLEEANASTDTDRPKHPFANADEEDSRERTLQKYFQDYINRNGK